MLSSLHAVELVHILEQEFGFEISILKIDFDTFRSMCRIAQFVSGSLRAPSEMSGESLVVTTSA